MWYHRFSHSFGYTCDCVFYSPQGAFENIYILVQTIYDCVIILKAENYNRPSPKNCKYAERGGRRTTSYKMMLHFFWFRRVAYFEICIICNLSPVMRLKWANERRKSQPLPAKWKKLPRLNWKFYFSLFPRRWNAVHLRVNVNSLGKCFSLGGNFLVGWKAQVGRGWPDNCSTFTPSTMTYIKVEEMHLPPRSFKRNQIIAAASHGVWVI